MHSNRLETASVATNDRLEKLINTQDAESIIDLSHQRLTDKDMVTIVKLAIGKKQCRILNLWGNQFTAASMPMLVNGLYDNYTLEELDLSYNQLGDEGVKVIADFFALNESTVKELDLSSNGIGTEGAEHLAGMLAKNKTLRILSLNKNELDDEDLEEIASKIADSKGKLRQLRLESNDFITRRGIIDALRALRENKTLHAIYVKGCTNCDSNEAKRELREESFRTGFDVFV